VSLLCHFGFFFFFSRMPLCSMYIILFNISVKKASVLCQKKASVHNLLKAYSSV